MKKYQKSLFQSTEDWQRKKFSYPKNTIRLGSLFSGIGAFEQALQILGIKTKPVESIRFRLGDRINLNKEG